MNALLILIPIGLVLAAVAVAIFFWATSHGQFDDLDSPAILPLLDAEDAVAAPSAAAQEATAADNEPR
ncbi:MAG TPA: cbb3-type cytochrome oxidase assembly protein CcoS [Rhodanobacteraceae bacterium]|nr:cbb3-type cytochrome oxidase assembly protein CcoS [Rhodanobacteraceae bacterium]